jgi:hypothetical protein
MPFILSHPAAVVPLARLVSLSRAGLPLSALVVGSMAPDLPHFLHLTHLLRWSNGKHFGHTFAGTFLFCVPVGMLSLWLFHIVIKPPLLSLFPVNQQERLAPIAAKFRFGPSGQFLLIIVALLLGAFTHIIWDSFTHASGWPVQQFSILQTPIMQTARGPIFVFNLVQRGSTLVGAALLFCWCLKWLKETPAHPVCSPAPMSALLKPNAAIFMAATAFVLASIYAYWKSPVFPGLGWHQPFARRVIITGVAVASVELLIFSFGWHWKAFINRPSGIISHLPSA